MSMLCHDVQDRLSSYLDDELSTDALVGVRTHIVDCGDCSERRDAMARVDDLIGASLSDHPFGDAAVESILGKLDLTEMAFKEALRFVPPVPSMPRRALKSFEYSGYRIPAGAHVGINIHYRHNDEKHWEDPYTFDPMRFTPEQVKARHKYAWVPFGGGAHMCLGLHFAYMQVKILLAQMLPRYRIELAAGDPEWQAWPIPKPKDGLKLKLTAI